MTHTPTAELDVAHEVGSEIPGALYSALGARYHHHAGPQMELLWAGTIVWAAPDVWVVVVDSGQAFGGMAPGDRVAVRLV